MAQLADTNCGRHRCYAQPVRSLAASLIKERRQASLGGF